MGEDNAWQVLGGDEVQYGPYTAEQLMAFAQDGTIDRDSMVWTEGLAEWIPAGQVEGLFLLQVAAPVTAAPSGSSSSSNGLNIDNRVSCPKCQIECSFAREMAGKKERCPFCGKGTLHYPEFNEDLLGVEEALFFRLPSESRDTVAEEDHTLELNRWHFLALLLGFPVLWIWFRSSDDIGSPFGAAMGATFGLGMVYLVVHGVVIKGAKKKAVERRIGRIGAMTGQASLSMGGTLKGHVHLELENPLNAYSVGVSLELQAYKADTIDQLRRVLDSEGNRIVREHVLLSCRSSTLVASRHTMNAGAGNFQFSIVAPVHQAHQYEAKEFEMIPWEELRFRKKTSVMDAQSLLESTKLRWLLHAELLGTDGVLLRSQRVLTVSGLIS